MPDESHASYFDYSLKERDEVTVWVGTYNNTLTGTDLESGFWSYGETITLVEANTIKVFFAIISTSLIVLF